MAKKSFIVSTVTGEQIVRCRRDQQIETNVCSRVMIFLFILAWTVSCILLYRSSRLWRGREYLIALKLVHKTLSEGIDKTGGYGRSRNVKASKGRFWDKSRAFHSNRMIIAVEMMLPATADVGEGGSRIIVTQFGCTVR